MCEIFEQHVLARRQRDDVAGSSHAPGPRIDLEIRDAHDRVGPRVVATDERTQSGEQLVFNAPGEGGRDLYVLDLGTSQVSRNAETPEYETDPFRYLPPRITLSAEELDLANRYERGDFSGGYIT